MITDPEAARQVSELMLEAFHRLDHSCEVVKQCCTEEEAAAFRDAIEKVTAPLVLDVLEPLYDTHPELKPAHWDDDAPDEPSM